MVLVTEAQGAEESGYGNNGNDRQPGNTRQRAAPQLQLVEEAQVSADYYCLDDIYSYHPQHWFTFEPAIHDLATWDGDDDQAVPAPRERGSQRSSSSLSSSASDCAAVVATPSSRQLSVALALAPRERRLLELMDRTGYTMIQDNGQRRYGPPPFWQGDPPPKGCEVFIGKLPRDLYEDELVPFLERAGLLYEVRLMMDFAGSNRGYAFATYSTRREALRAVRELDEAEIRRGRRVGVCESLDNCRLFVGGIPREKNRVEVLEEMRRVTSGVEDVILYSDPKNRSLNRGFAFVEYKDHRAAAVARRRMIPGKMTLFGGYEVAVDWAQPEPIVDEETMSKVTTLYVRNLLLSTPADVVREAFSLQGQVCVFRVKKIRDFAFIHYDNREDAAMALKAMKGAVIDGSRVEGHVVKASELVETFRSSKEFYKKGQAVGYGFYPVASHHVPPPIGSGRPGGGEAVIHGHHGGPVFPHQASARSTSVQQKIQLLTEVCERYGLGVPQFNLVTVMSTEYNPVDGNQQTPLHYFKVTLPNIPPQMGNTITPNRFSRTVEQAREYAAEYALHHLLMTLDMTTPAQYPHLTSPLFVTTTAPAAYGPGYHQYPSVLPGAGSPTTTGPPWQPYPGGPSSPPAL
ncbi:hypothetical protein HPB50_023715 [Hyalomma asiaticum]|uniref:Uncharacterized protein n=1 Tax=Hyalomma asiaticum TaxID=266040 RepID=A0ACB7T6M4_HYAAI|nr:hypothetical protein HPB50_023715 [Hyalomma asiaticum]